MKTVCIMVIAGKRVILMFPRSWGKSIFRGRLLCLLSIVIFAGSGCRHAPQIPATRRYARLDTLLSLHPSWAQVTSLDQEITRFNTVSGQAGTLHYDPLPMPANFTPEEISSTNMAAERAKQIDRDAARYVDSLKKSLDSVNQSIMNRARRREKQRVETEVSARLAEEERALRDLNEVKAFSIRQQIRNLTFRDLVVQSRIQDLSQGNLTDPAPLKAAQAEHTQLTAQIERLNAENRDLLTEDILAKAAKKRDQFIHEAQISSQERLNQREETLAADKEEKVMAAIRQQKDTSIPPPAIPELPPPDPRATPLPLPPDSTQSIPLSEAQSRVNVALARQRSLWQTQRANLVAGIRTDTEKAAEQIAAEHGWILVRQGTPGALDATAEIADALRAQWRQGDPK